MLGDLHPHVFPISQAKGSPFCLTTLYIHTHARTHAHTQARTHTHIYQGKQSCVSSQESCVAYNCVIYRNPYLTIFNSFYIYNYCRFLPDIYILCPPYSYTTLHIKFKGNLPNSLWDTYSWKFLDFLHIFLLCTVLKNSFEPTKDILLMKLICSKFGTLVRHFMAYLSLKYGDV